MNLAQLVVSLTSDTSSFVTGMRAASREATQFEGRIGQAGRSSARVGGILFDVAANALGLSNKMGRLAEIVGTFAVGGALATGVVAGLALMTKGIREAREEQEKAYESANALIEKWRQVTGQPLRKQLEESRQTLERLRGFQRDLAAGFLPRFNLAERAQAGIGFFDSAEEARKKAREWVDTMIRELTAARDKLGTVPLEEIVVRASKPEKAGQRIGSDLANAIVLSFEEQLRRRNRLGSEWMESLVKRAEATNLRLQEALEPIGSGTWLEGVLKDTPIGRMRDQAKLWEQTWKNALESVQGHVADFFTSLFEQGTSFLDLLRQILRTAARIAAELLARQLVTGIAGAIGLGGAGGTSSSGGGAAGLMAPMRAGDVYYTTNVYQIQAVDAKSVADLLMANRHSVALATGRAQSESRGLQLMNRGW